MKIGQIISAGLAIVFACVLQSASQGQVRQAPLTPAMQYFGSRSANAISAAQQAPVSGRVVAVGHQQLQAPGGKPFEYIQRQPTLSPYLALDAVPESSTSLPNWHLFVQPQMRQRSAGEARARELVRARQQMRVATSRHMVPESAPASVPITGSSNQFLNMGSYFPGAR